jgi:hypothetical protein
VRNAIAIAIGSRIPARSYRHTAAVATPYPLSTRYPRGLDRNYVSQGMYLLRPLGEFATKTYLAIRAHTWSALLASSRSEAHGTWQCHAQ